MGRILSDEEVKGLETVLVEGEHSFEGFEYVSGYRGLGGSNPYGGESSAKQVSLEELCGRKIEAFGDYGLGGFAVAAVIDDDVYFLDCGKVVHGTAPCGLNDSGGIAYDTLGWVSLKTVTTLKRK